MTICATMLMPAMFEKAMVFFQKKKFYAERFVIISDSVIVRQLSNLTYQWLSG